MVFGRTRSRSVCLFLCEKIILESAAIFFDKEALSVLSSRQKRSVEITTHTLDSKHYIINHE